MGPGQDSKGRPAGPSKSGSIAQQRRAQHNAEVAGKQPQLKREAMERREKKKLKSE
jgi:hypothetical protein